MKMSIFYKDNKFKELDILIKMKLDKLLQEKHNKLGSKKEKSEILKDDNFLLPSKLEYKIKLLTRQLAILNSIIVDEMKSFQR